MAVTLAEVDRSVGLAVYDAVLTSQEWIHRKVESLSMLEEDEGRRKVSLDVTPREDSRLAIGGHAGRQSYLPVAILAKVQIRDIDIRDAADRSVSMVERSIFEWLEISALVAQIEQKGNVVGDALLADLNAIVRLKPEAAFTVAEELLAGTRTYEGFRVDTLPTPLRRFIHDLAGGFLLVVVISSTMQGERSVIKYSTYWPQPGIPRFDFRHPGRSARRAVSNFVQRVGWFPFHYSIDVSGAAFAASYHLQIRIPEALGYDRLELPRSEGSSARVDIERSVIAHGGAHYDASAEDDATLVVRNPSRGRLGAVLGTAALSVAVFSAFAWTGLSASLGRNSTTVESSLAFLLLLPAALIALGSRNRENTIAAAATSALRFIALTFAACYLTVGASLILFAEEEQTRPILHVILVVVWALAIVLLIPVLVGYVRTLRAERHYRESPDPDQYDDYHVHKPRASRLWRAVGVEESVLHVSTIEANLTVLRESHGLSSDAAVTVTTRVQRVLPEVIDGLRTFGPLPADPGERDGLVGRVVRDRVRKDDVAIHVLAREARFDADESSVDSDAEVLVGHIKGRRLLPSSETVDHVVAIIGARGSVGLPSGAWMTVVVARPGSLPQIDPKSPLPDLLHALKQQRSDSDPFGVVVPEGALNDRVARLVEEFGSTRVIPERAAVFSAIEVMTSATPEPLFYGTVGAVEGMGIVAAARLIGVSVWGSFGSPDVLAASGGAGAYSGWYEARELFTALPAGLIVCSRDEIDTLARGMRLPVRASTSRAAAVVIGGSTFSAEVVAGVREATDAAAAASRRWVGKGDKLAVDAAAVAAMRTRLNEIPFRGRVVIGEGEKDRAPMLANGELLGTGGLITYDVAVDPLDGTRLAAEGIPGAICVIALAPAASLFDPVDVFYMDKLIAGPAARGALDIRRPIGENVNALAEATGVRPADLTVVVLDKPRHRDLIAELRTIGVKVRLVGEGDVSVAVRAASGLSDIDLVAGVGGTPEGVVAACAVRALGGFMQARLAPQSREQRLMALAAGHDLARVLELDDLVASDDVLFVSSPVT